MTEKIEKTPQKHRYLSLTAIFFIVVGLLSFAAFGPNPEITAQSSLKGACEVLYPKINGIERIEYKKCLQSYHQKGNAQ